MSVFLYPAQANLIDEFRGGGITVYMFNPKTGLFEKL